jgi:hypothetical protein
VRSPIATIPRARRCWHRERRILCAVI